METPDWYIGIDIAKAKVDVAAWAEGQRIQYHTFPQTPAGHADLEVWLQALGGPVKQVCLEATGTYGDALALRLQEAGYWVSVLNPAVLKAFRQSTLTRTKNDRTDAVLLAQYGAVHHPPAWKPPTAAARELQALTRRVASLRAMRQQDLNRREASGRCAEVDASISLMVAAFDQEIARLEERLQTLVAQDAVLHEQVTLMDSVTGIGVQTATAVLAECGGDLRRFENVREVDAFAGVTPKEHASGSSVHRQTRLSKTGSARLRKLLYFPAISAKTHNPIVRAFCEQLLARGKPMMSVIGAAMRKLLHLMYGVVKSGKPFDPNYLQKRHQPA